MLTWIALCLASVLPAADARVQPLSGPAVEGQLIELEATHVAIQAVDGASTLPSAQLADVRLLPIDREPPMPITQRAIAVKLIDGTELAAEHFSVEGSEATIDLVGGERVIAPVRSVQTARFNKQGPSVRSQWQEIRESPAKADVLVIRKVSRVTVDGEEKVQIGLDHLEGILFDIREETVGFEFDGTRVDVPRTKVEGILYHRPQTQSLPDPACRVVDRQGSSWYVRSLRLQDTSVQMTSVAGVPFSLPLPQLAQVDFSVANLLYLTDLPPERVTWVPYLQSTSVSELLQVWFHPRNNLAFYGERLTVGGQTYDRGLALHSRTEMTFRLTHDYRRFQATAGIDDRFRSTGNVRLVISSEQETLFDQSIKGTDKPLELDIDVRGARRLRLLVDYGDDRSDSGDLLNLGNARLTQ